MTERRPRPGPRTDPSSPIVRTVYTLSEDETYELGRSIGRRLGRSPSTISRQDGERFIDRRVAS